MRAPLAAAAVVLLLACSSAHARALDLEDAYAAHANVLHAHAADLVADAVSAALASRLAGVPGTALAADADARALQAHLDCLASEGEWVHDPRGTHLAAHGRALTVHKHDGRYAACDRRYYKGREASTDPGHWDVRPSLQWRWVPSPSCAALAPGGSHTPDDDDDEPPSRARFCALLAHKATLLVGDATQYSLHDLLLDYAATTPQSCYGDLYCKEHGLCAEVLRAVREGRAHDVESTSEDERVYVDLPLPPGMTGAGQLQARRTHADGHAERALRYSSPSYGTLLRYRRSDGLRPAMAHTAPTYRHPETGVREVNQPWLADARRSDVVVLTKAPLPLPLRSANASFWDALDAAAAAGSDQRAQALLALAAEWTARVWLPELVDALRAIRAPPSPPDVLVIYRGGWRQHADCAAPGAAAGDGPGPGPHTAPPALGELLAPGVPLHVAWHNAQVALQNTAVRTVVAPGFGAVFLDLETPLAVWPAGMVGSSLAPSPAGLVLQGDAGGGRGLRTPASGDCTRYCLPSPGLALETHFVGALARVLRLAWAGSPDVEREWVGDAFVGIREREARRAGAAAAGKGGPRG
ncbi:hypothetical protein JCM3770_003929 [Rhodotorula araucariae]